MAEPSLSVRVRQGSPIAFDAELDCDAGEVLALTGPSGGGKTTLLRIIAGLARPADGTIACDGEIWLDTRAGREVPARERRVGFVLQSYGLFPHMTALENVAAGLGDRPAAERRSRAVALLERVHLKGLERRRPAELSGGQQQRVAVARALARDPKVLLLDEPFSAVDRATRERLYQELAQLRRELRMPVVLVTHDLDEAAMLSDRMCILHRGRTLQTARSDLLRTQPRNAEVARLVGLRNVFEGVVREHNPSHTLIDWAGRVLEARSQPQFAAGSRIFFAVPSSHIVLHRRDRPSRGEHENPVEGTVTDCIPLGENSTVTLQVRAAPAALQFSVPTHVARRNRVQPGEPAAVSLLADGLHLMPWEPTERREASGQ